MQNQNLTYYDTLDLTSSATAEDIKSSFRALAKKHHPDKHNNSPESQARFILLFNAYTVLSDPRKRAEYDTYIHASSVFKTHVKTDLKTTPLPGRPGEVYYSTDEILAHLNFLLWDIEDLIRNKKSIIWQEKNDSMSAQYYILKVLTFVDAWILEPGGFGDYFMQARKLEKHDPADYVKTIGKQKGGHQPYANLNDYFYNIRMRIDKFLNTVTTSQLIAQRKDHDITLLECIVEAQNYIVHVLSFLLQPEPASGFSIPEFEHSHQCFIDNIDSCRG